MKFVSNIDLNKNQLLNAVIQQLATAPTSPLEGQIYWDTTDHHIYAYNNASFKKVLFAGEVTNSDIASNAAISLSKLAVDPLARSNHTGTQLAATISDFNAQVRTNALDQLDSPTSALNLNGQRLTNIGTPTSPNDAVNKSYADSLSLGLDAKLSVRVATTANITLSGLQTIDGVSLGAGDRVLVKDQTTGSQNGLWVVSTGTWTRATDADSDNEVTAGLFTFVEEGNSFADSGWVLATNNPITVGSTSLTFTQFSAPGLITAGAGLTKTGNSIDVGTVSSSRIVVNADNIDLATVGSVGTYNSVTVDAYGRVTAGTNPTTLAGYGITDGVKKYAGNVGDGTSTSITVTHNLQTKDVITKVRQNSDDAEVYVDVTNSTITTITLNFTTAPATNAYRVVVMG